MEEKEGIFLEKYITIICSLIVILIFTIAFLKLNIKEIKIEKIDLLFSSIFTIITTIIGFLLTGLTIIMSLMQTRVMRIIRSNSGEKLLSKYFISPIVWGIISIVYMLIIGFSLNDDNIVKSGDILILLFFIVLFGVATIRITYFMKKMFLKISDEYKANDAKAQTKKAKENSVHFTNT